MLTAAATILMYCQELLQYIIIYSAMKLKTFSEILRKSTYEHNQQVFI